jgi:hypothetical protein
MGRQDGVQFHDVVHAPGVGFRALGLGMAVAFVMGVASASFLAGHPTADVQPGKAINSPAPPGTVTDPGVPAHPALGVPDTVRPRLVRERLIGDFAPLSLAATAPVADARPRRERLVGDQVAGPPVGTSSHAATRERLVDDFGPPSSARQATAGSRYMTRELLISDFGRQPST